uniref:GGDEF domain-containing protein n=1 Tax=Thaumasiovibrio occultus TaxID=1891184 RepID=UPI00131CFB3C|nr:GGDEF domain-containing protein [Thaumasiovibrio occultus]
MNDNQYTVQLSILRKKLEEQQQGLQSEGLKNRRERHLLRRFIGRISQGLKGYSAELDALMADLRQALENPDVQVDSLIPKLAMAERMTIRQTENRDKEFSGLALQVSQSGDVLKRVRGLPAQLKRELNGLLLQHNNPSQELLLRRTTRLLSMYDRAVKLITASHDFSGNLRELIDKDLQLSLSNELQHLITELDFDGQFGDQLLDIRNQLLLGVDSEKLMSIALQVIRLVLDGTHAERQASQQFLTSINQDLASLKHSTSKTLEHSESVVANHSELNAELSRVGQNLQVVVQDPTNMQAMVKQVGDAQQAIQALVERNRALEKHQQTLIDRIQFNESRLQQLCDQTADYRRRLNDQERKVFLDHLTKVYNRAALADRLDHEYKRWLRHQHPLCIAFVDLDHFKDINDSYGHSAGDKALKIIARTIFRNMPDTDFVARYGGEEFVLIMPEREKNILTEQLNQIREAIAALPFKFRDRSVSISASIGATLFTESDTPQQVLDRADRALYDAKDSGRNRLIWV